MYTLRPYQEEAVERAVNHFRTKENNAVIVCPTGCGKSLIVAETAHRMGEPILVFAPSKELVEQNHEKMLSYGETDCSMYSASVGVKEISKITFATIGSVKANMADFKHFKYVIIDECHRCNSDEGLYLNFIREVGCKVIGLTATPYRLVSDVIFNYKERKVEKAVSRLITLGCEKTPIFSEYIYNLQVSDAKDVGYLADLEYFNLPLPNLDISKIKRNSTGTDYDEKSLRDALEKANFRGGLINLCNRLLAPKGRKRNGILVFTRFVEDAEFVCNNIPGARIVTGKTSKKERTNIIAGFKSGEIPVVLNTICLSTGFDYPELDTIVIARPTLSLSLYYQMVGRAIRPSPKKDKAWVIDLCGTYKRFGKVENIRFEQNLIGEWNVIANNRLVTNCTL